MEWYFVLGIVSYSLFIIQFLLTFIGIVDLDFDFDLGDFSFSDLISFKGLVHFCMGLSGWLMLVRDDHIIMIILGVTMGLAFMLVLAATYALCFKLSYEPHSIIGDKLVGHAVAILAPLQGDLYLGYLNVPIYTELKCISTEQLKVGDVREIKAYKNGLYFI